MRPIRVLLTVAFLVGAGISAQAQTANPPGAGIEFIGVPKSPIALTTADLAKLPSVEQDITFKTSKGVQTGHYKGPLLWEVLQANKVLDGLEHNKELTKTLLVTAEDDYQIAFSIGEISPEFGNAMILVALEVDGKPLEKPRIVAQGDKRGARAVRDVIKIELR